MQVQIVRSARRTKTVSARLVDGALVVHAPENLTDAELERIVQKLSERVQKQAKRATLDDRDLERRARELNARYFGGKLEWQSIRWVTNQNKRVGSCTPKRGTLRISHRVAQMPRFVQDYVIVHELAHLVVPHHGPEFWRWVERYPKAERARGFLMGAELEPVEE